jgi:hypothetical protein
MASGLGIIGRIVGWRMGMGCFVGMAGATARTGIALLGNAFCIAGFDACFVAFGIAGLLK